VTEAAKMTGNAGPPGNVSDVGPPLF
jgi:hypothetical protein